MVSFTLDVFYHNDQVITIRESPTALGTSPGKRQTLSTGELISPAVLQGQRPLPSFRAKTPGVLGDQMNVQEVTASETGARRPSVCTLVVPTCDAFQASRPGSVFWVAGTLTPSASVACLCVPRPAPPLQPAPSSSRPGLRPWPHTLTPTPLPSPHGTPEWQESLSPPPFLLSPRAVDEVLVHLSTKLASLSGAPPSSSATTEQSWARAPLRQLRGDLLFNLPLSCFRGELGVC